MERGETRTAFRMMLFLMLIGISTWAFSIYSVNPKPEVWTVDDDGSADFRTVQEAINHAGEGDSIFIMNGLYHENIIVNKTVSLIGEKPETTKIHGGETGPAIYIEADNALVKGLTFEVTYDTRYSCVRLYNSNNSLFTGNVVLSGFFGIHMSKCKNNTVKDNTCNANFDYGILVGGSYNNIVCGNNVTYTWYGIGMWNSSSNIIDGNAISGTGRGGGYPTSFEPAGVLLWNHSSKNKVVGNKIHDNKHNGVSIVSFSTDNLIVNNVISRNRNYGVWLEEYSTGNTFYHNAFDNQRQVYVQNSSNLWDCGYPCGGNHWSDYTGVDSYSGPYQNETGSDGIGDIPYVVNANNLDNYPLMQPWDINPPLIATPYQKPENYDVRHNQVVTVSVNVTDLESGVKNVVLHYTTNSSISWINLTMLYNETCSLYQATIQAFSAGIHISYEIIAYDNVDNVAINDNAGEYYGYTVKPLSQPHGPKAEFTAIPEEGCIGESVKFDASASQPGWNGTHTMLITEYRWDFGDGNKTTITTPIIYHSYKTAGNYYATLTVCTLGATPETDSITHKITAVSVPVGGHSFPTEGYAITKQLIIHLSLTVILIAAFVVKHKILRKLR